MNEPANRGVNDASTALKTAEGSPQLAHLQQLPSPANTISMDCSAGFKTSFDTDQQRIVDMWATLLI